MTDDDKTEETAQIGSEAPTEQAPTPPSARRLLRSRDDRMIAGVSGGLARYFDIDPVIIRIAFAVSIFFGGLGVLAYIAAIVFVPTDDGSGNPVPSSRGRTLGRVIGVGLLAILAIGGFGGLVATAAFITGMGYGVGVVALIAVIGIALIVLSLGGGAKWLIVPALALSLGVGVAAAADLDLEGGIGKRDYRPASAAALPGDGYELGVGRLSVDLRGIDWTPERVIDVDVRIGAGEAVIAVPANVCVVARAHADAGDLQVTGQQSDGWDVDSTVGEGSSATPRLELDADVGFGQLRVVNDDDVNIADRFGDRFDRFRGGDPISREANARACAG